MSLKSLKTHLGQGHTVSVTGASGGAASFVLAAIGAAIERPVAILTSTPERSQELASELNVFVTQVKGDAPSIVEIPGPDTSPYHQISPNRFLMMQRLASLHQLVHGASNPLIVMPVCSFVRATLPRAQMADVTLCIRQDDDLCRDTFLEELDQLGYARVPVVEDPGTVAVRGGLIDVFSPLYKKPIRIDLFGDTVESLRFFSPRTQRGQRRSAELKISPASETILTDQNLSRARQKLRLRAPEIDVPGPQVRAILAELEQGIRPPGIEGWLPAVYDELSTVQDYIPANALWCIEEPADVSDAFEEAVNQAQALYEHACSQGRVVYDPGDLYAAELPAFDCSLLSVSEDNSADKQINLACSEHAALRQQLRHHNRVDGAFEPAARAIKDWLQNDFTVVCLGATNGQVERLRGLLENYGLPCQVMDGQFDPQTVLSKSLNDQIIQLHTGRLRHGFVDRDNRWVLLGNEDILPPRADRRSRSQAVTETSVIESMTQIEEGDLIVHIDHGIGQYQGLVKLEAGEIENDFLKLVYRDGDLLYVPVQTLDRIQKYKAGQEKQPKLDKLGGTSWETTKRKARKAAEEMASELLELHARRLSQTRKAYSSIGTYYNEFCAGFPFQETPDQDKAISDVMSDMDRAQPMDRLVCGDVGYGKTEVAMRAAFRAVLDNKQVAVLVPTTVLAEQHLLTFRDRFRGYPINIECLSRFRKKKESTAILEAAERGAVDILIGTHRLLQKDVHFHQLGLLVIDEEHRFGVRHKERIKRMRNLVDVLTLTATPIPRTLNMALAGIRDLSVIATPPTDRLSVRTLVNRTSDDVIRESVSRELKRGGQVFVVHNRVETIQRIAARVAQLVPGARIVVGHGQMTEVQLEKVMLSFMAGDADILVSTTIIESGLDVPRANTMLIDKAHMFGLAQLYQLRGRIGRSNRRGYCHLLVEEPGRLDPRARKRIEAIQRFSDLGSGFNIAAMDLEIRGAGNLLGRSQAGHVHQVGLDLFSELLAEAVAELKGDDEAALERISCEMKVGLPAFLPEKYVSDVPLRLMFYKRIASSRTHEGLAETFEELVDRFGRPPQETVNLFAVTRLKIDCQTLGAKSLSYNHGGLVMALDHRSPLASAKVIELVQRQNTEWRLTPDMELCRVVSKEEWSLGLRTAHNAINELLTFASEPSVC